MPNYNNTSIYKLFCKDPSVENFYIGSTCNLYRRKAEHKSICNNENANNYNLPVYQFIRENGGFNNWDMIELHNFSCENKREKEREERKWIEELKPTLNKCIPTRTKKQWRQDNKEIIAQKKKQYRQNNMELIAKKKKHYYEANKEAIAEKNKVKFTCECGTTLTKCNKTRHERSKKHQNYINSQ